MIGGSTTEHAVYNNYVANSLSFAKSPLEALDSNGGLTGAWNESRRSHRLNCDTHDDYTDTGLCHTRHRSCGLRFLTQNRV